MTAAFQDYLATLRQGLGSRTARSTGLVMGANLTSALFRFVLTMAFAKLLAKEDWAYFYVFVTLMELVSNFTDSGLTATQVRFMAAHGSERPHGIIRRCLQLRLLTSVAALGLLAVGWRAFASWLEIPPEYMWLYPLAVVGGLFMSHINTPLAALQGRERYKLYCLQFILTNMFRFLVIGSLLWFGFRDIRLLYGLFFLLPVLSLGLGIPLARTALRPTRDLPETTVTNRDLLRFLAPLAVMNGAIMVIIRADAFMVKAMAPDAVAGYGLAYTVAFAFPLLARSLFAVLLPKVSALTEAKDLAAYRRRVLQAYPVGLAATAAAIWVVPILLTLVFGDKYAGAIPVLRVLILGFGIELIFNPLGLIFYALKRPQNMTIIHLIQLAVLLPLNYFVMIPQYEGVGAALSLLIVRAGAVVAVIAWTKASIRAKQRVGRTVLVTDPRTMSPNYDQSLVSALRDEGADARLLTADFYPETYVPAADVPGRQYFFLRLSRILRRRSGRSRVLRTFAVLLSVPEYVMDLFRLGLLCAVKRPVLHVEWILTPLLDIPFLLYARAIGIRVVYTVHNPLPHDKETRLNRLFYGVIYRLANHLIFHSNVTVDDFRAFFPLPEGRWSVIPIGLSFPAKAPVGRRAARQRLGWKDDETVFVFQGMVKEYKGLDVLLRALADLDARGRNIRLVISASWRFAPDKPGLERLLATLASKHTVDNTDEITDEDKYVDLACGADAFVLPYRSGTASVPGMAAMRFGTPIIATQVGAFRDMLGPEHQDYLVPPNDADALRAALARFIDASPDERTAFRTHILERGLQHFSWDTIARQTLRVYQHDASSGCI